jgi:hypothetical protein
MLKWIARKFSSIGPREHEGFDVMKREGFSLFNRAKLCSCHFYEHALGQAHRSHDGKGHRLSYCTPPAVNLRLLTLTHLLPIILHAAIFTQFALETILIRKLLTPRPDVLGCSIKFNDCPHPGDDEEEEDPMVKAMKMLLKNKSLGLFQRLR